MVPLPRLSRGLLVLCLTCFQILFRFHKISIRLAKTLFHNNTVLPCAGDIQTDCQFPQLINVMAFAISAVRLWSLLSTFIVVTPCYLLAETAIFYPGPLDASVYLSL
jgi:hypothetical protein